MNNSMTIAAALLIWIPLCILVSTYFMYPLLLILLTKGISPDEPCLEKESENNTDQRTAISVIFTFVTASPKIVEQRIQNILHCTYTKGPVEIIAVGDGAQTKTVLSTLNKKDWSKWKRSSNKVNSTVKLVCQKNRSGKTAAQNRAVEMSEGEVLVFTDVNSEFHINALENIVSPLEHRHPAPEQNNEQSLHQTDSDSRLPVMVTAGVLFYKGKGAEKGYWSKENYLRKLESRLHSTIGANGALYALRRERYILLPEHSISDFVQPLLQLIINGGRTLFTENAIVYEEVPCGYKNTYLRKRRITARALKSLPLLLPLLNPLLSSVPQKTQESSWKTSVYQKTLTWLFFCFHKLLRWTTALCAVFEYSGLLLYAHLQGYLLLAITVTLLMFTFLWGIYHFRVSSPVAETCMYSLMTLYGQLWAYYATFFGVNTTIWEPLKHRQS